MMLYIICVIFGVIVGYWAKHSDMMHHPDHAWYFRWYKNHQKWKYKPMEQVDEMEELSVIKGP